MAADRNGVEYEPFEREHYVQWRAGELPAARDAANVALVEYAKRLRAAIGYKHLSWPPSHHELDDILTDSFWRTMEDLDAGISGGMIWLDPTDDPNVRIGHLSKRLFGQRKQIEWQGKQEFDGLVWQIWKFHAIDLRGKRATTTRKIVRPGPVEQNYGDEPPRPEEQPDPWGVEGWAAIIRQVELLIEFGGAKPGTWSQRLAEAHVLYIKYCLWCARIVHSPGARAPTASTLAKLQTTPIEKLKKPPTLGRIQFDSSECRDFLWQRFYPDWTAADHCPEGNRWLNHVDESLSTTPPAIDCSEVRSKLGAMVRDGQEAAERWETELSHLQSCRECREALGEEYLYQRSHNTLSKNLSEFRARFGRFCQGTGAFCCEACAKAGRDWLSTLESPGTDDHRKLSAMIVSCGHVEDRLPDLIQARGLPRERYEATLHHVAGCWKCSYELGRQLLANPKWEGKD